MSSVPSAQPEAVQNQGRAGSGPTGGGGPQFFNPSQFGSGGSVPSMPPPMPTT